MSKKAEKVYCDRCKKECKPDDCSPGYGTVVLQPVSADKHFCYQCCADLDKEEMEKTGKIWLHLTHDNLRKIAIYPITNDSGHYVSGQVVNGTVSNWPGTLSFPCRVKVSKHNMARYRYDVWFKDHNGNHWHGVQYGDDTTCCFHRLKRKSKMLKDNGLKS